MGKIVKNIYNMEPKSKQKLDYVHIYITRKCNLYCKHCYTNSSIALDEMLPYSFWDDTINQLLELKTKTIHIEGGEALMHPDIEKIVKKISDSKVRELIIVTNGILATREKLQGLRYAGLKKIAISLDSLKGEVHDLLRPKSHSYAMNAIRTAVDIGFHTRVSSVLTKKNVADFKEFVDGVYKMGVKTLNIDWFNSAGRGAALFDEFAITAADTDILTQFEKDVYEIVNNPAYEDFNLSIDLPEWFCRRDSYMAKDTQNTHFMTCDAIVEQISINESGNIYPCFIFSNGEGMLGNLQNSRMRDILEARRDKCIKCPIGVNGHMFYQKIF